MQLKKIGLWSAATATLFWGVTEMGQRRDVRHARVLMEARLEQERFDKKQVTCLATNAYYEARGDNRRSMIAVSQVVMNRADIRKSTPCSVVYERNNRGCQFSWTCDPQKSNWDDISYRRALAVAHDVYYGKVTDIVNGATHYHTKAINPYWSRSKKFIRLDKIGSHVYYKSLEHKWKIV
jgi:spore germination cell wall hydrolase CwlJ-like protein